VGHIEAGNADGGTEDARETSDDKLWSLSILLGEDRYEWAMKQASKKLKGKW